MSIHVLAGKPGAGKSYNAVQRAEEAIDAGRVVVTNLPLKKAHPKWAAAIEERRLILYPTPAETIADANAPSFANWAGWSPIFAEEGGFKREVEEEDGSTKMMGPLVLVDESSATFAEMHRKSKGRNATRDFDQVIRSFEVHRHHGVDILLIYQDHSQALAPIKALVERWHTFTNTSEATHPLKTWSMKTTSKGFSPGSQSALDTKKGRFKDDIFALYDSHAEGAGKGQKVDIGRKGLLKSKPLWARPSFIVVALGLVLLPVFLWLTWGSIGSVTTGSTDEITFGSAASAAVPDEALPVGQSAGVPAPVAPVTKLEFDDEGIPLGGSVISGFAFDRLYFAEGHVVDVPRHLQPQGWFIVSAEPCRVEIAKGEELRVFPCSRGY